jgi:hypothetical protein
MLAKANAASDILRIMAQSHRAYSCVRFVVLALSVAMPMACDDDEAERPPAPTHEQQLADAIVGKWELDPEDRKEFINILPSGDFGGAATYNGLATADNPAGQRARIAGQWRLEGNLLTFYVIESSDPDLANKAVRHRVLSMTNDVIHTIFEGEHRMEIYRRR